MFRKEFSNKAIKKKRKLKDLELREKMLNPSKKPELEAKRELRFTAGSQGHSKKNLLAKMIPTSSLMDLNSKKYRRSTAKEY